jgi:catechol 2,3-dioxygenase-like lactoylglutathione lyase family enzyme
MPTLRLDAVAVTSRDLAASVAFYRRLGFPFQDPGADAKHVEATPSGGGVRLMIDDADLIRDLTGEEPRPASHASFALHCGTPGALDEVVAGLRSAGQRIVKEPFDAPWGQRYAVIADPDGYHIDLFAPL